ncbi:hypothetical protein [Empedobacter sp. UBA7494]|uniref:hypothetical protein n=1 Tax=Empedobacter sp. UBA7494 TaxID=1946450 RepID=UPI0025BAFB84|nr:hypothetical protein [Empedobacter sp. UBA7494]
MDDRIRQRIEEIKQRGVNINVGDIFSKSWEIFSGIALYAILAIVITFAISFMINFFLGLFISAPTMVINDSSDLNEVLAEVSSPLALVSNIVSIVVAAALAPITVSILTMAKKFNKHQNPDFSDLFIHYKDGKFGVIFTTYLAVQFLGFIGILLCIVPGFIFYVTSILAIPFVLFTGFTTTEAIKSSVSILFKNFGSAFVFCLACFGVAILGALACGVGLLVAMPLIYIATYVLYETVIGTEDEEQSEIDQIGTDIYKDNPYMK